MSPEQIIEEWVTMARTTSVRGFLFPEHRRTAWR
jgi:hypothetical protein